MEKRKSVVYKREKVNVKVNVKGGVFHSGSPAVVTNRAYRSQQVALKKIEVKIDGQIERLEERYIKIISALEKEVNNLSKNYDTFKRNVYKEEFLKQQGVQQGSLSQIIPIKVYLASEESSKQVEDAMQVYIKEIGGEFIENYPPIYGSWFKEWVAKIYQGKTKEQIEDDFQKARKAIELKTISVPQSKVDLNNSDALSKLINSINDQEYAVLQVGALLIAKYQKNEKQIIVSKVLNVDELLWLESNQQLLSEPENILDNLALNTGDHTKLRQVK